MGVIKNRTKAHGKNEKKNKIVIKQRASTILTFSLNISTCDLDIFFSPYVCVCVWVWGGGGGVMF